LLASRSMVATSASMAAPQLSCLGCSFAMKMTRPRCTRPAATLHHQGSSNALAIAPGGEQAALGGVSYRLLRRVLGRDCGSETKLPVIMRNVTDWQSAAMLRRSCVCSLHASSGVRQRAMRNGRSRKTVAVRFMRSSISRFGHPCALRSIPFSCHSCFRIGSL